MCIYSVAQTMLSFFIYLLELSVNLLYIASVLFFNIDGINRLVFVELNCRDSVIP